MSEIRELLQHGVLQRPIELAGVGQVILSLTDSGAVTDIPVPTKENRDPPDPSEDGPEELERGGDPQGAAEIRPAPPSSGLGKCPLCGAEVREQQKSYSCSGWKQGCKFVIWKTIAGKKIGARTAKTMLTKGETRRLERFQIERRQIF